MVHTKTLNNGIDIWNTIIFIVQYVGISNDSMDRDLWPLNRKDMQMYLLYILE